MWQELARILALLISNYQKLQELNKEKHGVLVLAEKQRRQLLQKMADSGVKVRPDMEMHQVWEQCPNAQQKELLYKLHKMLAQLVKDVQEANANNEILITSALDAINAKLNQLGGSMVEPTYGSRGQEQVIHRKNFNLEA